MKECRRCKLVLPLPSFAKNKEAKDGLQWMCRECHSAYGREHFQKNRESYIHATRRRRERPEVKAERAFYSREYKKRDDPRKVHARNVFHGHLRRGNIVKPTSCQDCEASFPKSLIHAHHTDYAQPLKVEWLCASCHMRKHRRLETANA